MPNINTPARIGAIPGARVCYTNSHCDMPRLTTY